MGKIKTALISVYDKEGLEKFARQLVNLGIDIISTGGTSKVLKECGIEHKQVEDITGFPEVMNGRVKTLHPNIFMGILAKRDTEDHLKSLSEYNLPGIDMVVVNLYPFIETINKPGITQEEAVEQIDIGGVSLLRAAGKNFNDVAAVTTPDKYETIIEELNAGQNEISKTTTLKLAADLFFLTSNYDMYISEYLASLTENEEGFPEQFHAQLERVQILRYGENPHQKAALYHRAQETLPYAQLSGKELSYNNLIDIDSAISLANSFDKPGVAIIKHTNPCGAAIAENLETAFDKALSTDPVSAFGGIISCNRTLDKATAEKISKMFVEVVAAVDFEPEAYEIISQKKNLRIIKVNTPLNKKTSFGEIKTILGGILVQDKDTLETGRDEMKVVTSRQPTEAEWEALLFGWRVIKYVKSNAILYCDNTQTLGIGTGQMSRIDSAEIAMSKAAKAGLSLKGSALISDAFFPFRDGIDVAVKAGATAVIQPGGSIRDEEVIAAAEENKLTMVFTGVRHFRH